MVVFKNEAEPEESPPVVEQTENIVVSNDYQQMGVRPIQVNPQVIINKLLEEVKKLHDDKSYLGAMVEAAAGEVNRITEEFNRVSHELMQYKNQTKAE